MQGNIACIGSIPQQSGVHTVAIPSGSTPSGSCPDGDDQQGQNRCKELQEVVLVLEKKLSQTAEQECYMV